MSQQEQRLHPRRRLRSQVVFEDETGEGFIYFYTTDVSPGGLFLESDVPLKVGTRIFLSFTLPNLPPIRTVGRVVRIERDDPESAHIVGMGVQFVDLKEDAKNSIQNYVEPSGK